MADDEVAQRGQTTPTPDGTNGDQGQPPAQSTQPVPAPSTGDATGTNSGKVVFESEKDFQKEIDQRLGHRLAEERRKEREKYADYQDLKTKAARLAEIEQAQMTEAEKLQRQLEAAQQTIAKAEQARLDALESVKQSTIRAAVVSKAAELNFENPEDAYSLLDKTGLSISDAGQVEGAEAALKSLAETKKYLIKQHRQALEPFNPAGSGQQLQESDAARRARIYGSGGSMFDTGWAEQHGGGVVWPKGEPTDQGQ